MTTQNSEFVDINLGDESSSSVIGSEPFQLLMDNYYDPGVLRPWKDPVTNKCWITKKLWTSSGEPLMEYDPKDKSKIRQRVVNQRATQNASTLFYDEYKQIDDLIVEVWRNSLRAWPDLQKVNSRSLDGMASTIIQHQKVSDIGDATVSMDAMRQGERSRPKTDLVSLPLPIVHMDFSFSQRELGPSGKKGKRIDRLMISGGTRKIAEVFEKFTIGTQTYTYGGASIYGYTNFPDRITTTINLPTGGGWTPYKTVQDVMKMLQLAYNKNSRGSYYLYFGSSWLQYLGEDLAQTKAGGTLRERIKAIGDEGEKISEIRILDNLAGYTVLLVPADPSRMEAITGMPLKLLNWPSHGGLSYNYKLMAMGVPRLISDFNSQCGIVHATAV